jgi:hypothetical protein
MSVATKMAEARLSRPLEVENDLVFSADDRGLRNNNDDKI